MNFIGSSGNSIRLCTVVFVSFQLGVWSQDAFIGIKLLTPKDNTVTADTRSTDDPLASHSGDFSIPHPIYFSWTSTMGVPPSGYRLYLSKDSVIDSTDLQITGITDTFCAVWNLEINKNYFWMVSGENSLGNNVNSSLQSFATAPFWPRMLCIDGTTNVRDIGGCVTIDGKTIQQGLLYRSAEFNQTKNITEKGLEQLRQLGIVTEIDLKMNNERPENVIPWLPRYIRPLSNNGDGMALYLDGLTQTPEVVCAVFKEIADPKNYPMIIHCRMGADRTAEIVAMLEAILGCSDEQIILDYRWSSLSTFGIRTTTSVYWRDFIGYVRSFDQDSATVQKGSWNFLQTIGVSVEELVRIRSIFLDSGGQLPAVISDAGRLVRHVSSEQWQNRLSIIISEGYCDRYTPVGTSGRVFDLSGRSVFGNNRNNRLETWAKHVTRFAQGSYIVSNKE